MSESLMLGDELEPFDADNAFFENLGGAGADTDEEVEKPRKAPEKPAEAPEEPSEEEAPEKPSKAPEKAPEGLADDDDEVELPIDGKATKFTVKALREALAASAAPSAAITAQISTANAQVERATKLMDGLVTKATEAYAPYANVDWISLSRDPSISQENFEALRAEAMTAYQTLEATTRDRAALTAEAAPAAQAAAQAATQAMVQELQDPVKGIKGFGPAMVQELLGFVKDQGVPELATTTSAAMVRLMHQAMLYQKGQVKTETQVRKVVEQPKRVIRPGGSSKTAPGASRSQAITNLRKSSSSDAITDAFMADLSR